jgi:hypothetical protein
MFLQVLINSELIYYLIKVIKNRKVFITNIYFSVNINYLLKQPIFRTAEDILKNYKRPVNIRFESGMFYSFTGFAYFFSHLLDLTAPPTHRLFPITL